MWLIETSPLIRKANQWINFYKKETSVMKELNMATASLCMLFSQFLSLDHFVYFQGLMILFLQF